MNNRTADLHSSDAEEISDIWDMLSLKLQGMRMIDKLFVETSVDFESRTH